MDENDLYTVLSYGVLWKHLFDLTESNSQLDTSNTEMRVDENCIEIIYPIVAASTMASDIQQQASIVIFRYKYIYRDILW